MSSSLLSQAATAVAGLERLSRSAADYQRLTESELLALCALSAQIQSLASTHAALVAGDVARRSSRELGHSGLAQRAGFRTPEEWIRATTGSTKIDAASAVRVGSMMHDAHLPAPAEPWMRPVTTALTEQSLTVARAEAIHNGLGEPVEGVTASMLSEAAAQLCAESTALDAEQLYRRAREMRDELDAHRIPDREAHRRAQRSLRFTRLPDGMALISWRLDPESAAECRELFDRATSPKRGGPRFGPSGEAGHAAAIAADERTAEQLASDVFLQLLRQGADADSGQLLATGAPVVRVIVPERSLVERNGHGWIAGEPDPVAIETIERLACAGSVQPVMLDSTGAPIDVGREQRLFTRRQRIALAIRDGGCRWPGCERPPSWTEAHHIQHWSRDRGKTDIDNGVLLCRFHHLSLHNNHWEILRDGDGFVLLPPSNSPDKRPQAMPAKSHAVREAVASVG
jgi:hypothetical protein